MSNVQHHGANERKALRRYALTATALAVALVPLTAIAQDAVNDEPIVIEGASPSAPPTLDEQAAPAIEPTPLNPFRIEGRHHRRRPLHVPMFQRVAPRPSVHVRAGFSLPTFGFAVATGFGAVAPGLGIHLGAQFDRTHAVYFSGRFQTMYFYGYAQNEVIAEFAGTDGVQFGGGIGAILVYAGPNAAAAVTFPLHLGLTPDRLHTRDGRPTGLQLSIDVAPGFGSVIQSSALGFLLTANIGIGWEWF